MDKILNESEKNESQERGHENESQERGRQKEEHHRMDWKWVLIGFFVLVTGQIVAYWAFGSTIRNLVKLDRVITAFGLAGGLTLAIYFFQGVLVGRMSRGKTVAEPALAALLGLVGVSVLQLFEGMVNVFGILVGAPFCFGLAYLGGWVGEKWQGGRAGPKDEP